jgi:amidase
VPLPSGPLTHWTLRQIRDAIAEGHISPLEAWNAHRDRIAQVNPSLNAFTTLCKYEPPAARGPLYGVPLTIKDNFDQRGYPTLCGSKLRLGHRAEADAHAVALLRNAGATILGKTNVPELLTSYETDNFITGRTNHPLNPEHTPGGSSGGEAAAIASFCSAGGLGGDGGGSVRVPAHFCGLVGFKPTHRRIGCSGQFPLFDPPGGVVLVPGILARTVDDTALLFSVLDAVDPGDSLSVGRAAAMPPSTRRIGVVRTLGTIAVDPAIAAAVDDAAARFTAMGYAVEPVTLDGLERAPNVWAFLFAELANYEKRDFIAGREAEAHWSLLENLKDTPLPDARQVARQMAERERLRRLALDKLRGFDALLMPPCSIPAFRHRERRWQVAGQSIGLFAGLALSTIWNLMGFPALVLPWSHTDGGLPVGVQLVGAPFGDEELLALGSALASTGRIC